VEDGVLVGGSMEGNERNGFPATTKTCRNISIEELSEGGEKGGF